MERIKRKNTDVIIFICLLVLGIIITIFWNRIVGILISISSLIPVHQEIISVANKLSSDPENKGNKKTAQTIEHSHGAIQVIAEEDSVVHINQNMTRKKRRKK